MAETDPNSDSPLIRKDSPADKYKKSAKAIRVLLFQKRVVLSLIQAA